MKKVFVYITDNDARDRFNVYVLDDQRMIKDLERTGLKTIETVQAYINVLRQHYEVTSVEDIAMTADDIEAVRRFCEQNKQRGQKT
ncbi:hypothetical protein CEB3_c13430 [Peptococcaceae bacterium CEB3]|nr:hypothetical protein CEB3_c13430 [Peptococcaceae bacterium CEB3]